MIIYNKNKRLKIALIILYITVSAIVFCDPLQAENKINVGVSILPQQYFVQQIGKQMVSIEVMVPPGASPAIYEPGPAQMTALANTKAYFSIGVPFESVWLHKIAAINPGMRIFHTDEKIQKRYLENHICEEPPTGPGDKHHHPAMPSPEHTPDPHIWLSPPLVMMQAREILHGLQQVDPEHRDVYAQNYRVFILELVDVDDQLRKVLTDIRTPRFMVFHPAWGYFAQAYGLTQIPVEIEGKAPKPAQLKKIIDYARQHDLSFVLVQPQSVARYAEQVARAIDGQVLYADPLSPDWKENLLNVAVKIKTARQ